MTVPLDVLDPPNISAVVQPDASPQNAAGYASDSVTEIRFRSDANAVVTVDKGDIFHGVVAALKMKSPRIRVNFLGLLVGVENGETLDCCRVAKFK